MRHILACLLVTAIIAAADPAPQPAPDQRWAQVDAAMQRHAAERRAPGMGLVVYDRNDRLVFDRAYGDFATDRMVAVASASKLVSGILILDVVATSQGRLGLDSTTGQILGWTGPQAAITLRHLLSFTSGLAPGGVKLLPSAEERELFDADTTLEACVAAIGRQAPAHPPGTRFDYGSTHLQVAARMAEVVTGTTWNALFRARIGDPLHLPAGAVYYTQPRRHAGTTNPLIAGGLCISMRDYAPILATAFHRGAGPGGLRLASEALYAAQAREPFPVTVGASPMRQYGFDYRYGLACWLECADPQRGSEVISSAGAFGFTPWLDRAAGYYAIIAMEQFGGAKISFPIEQELQPLIRAALAAP